MSDDQTNALNDLHSVAKVYVTPDLMTQNALYLCHAAPPPLRMSCRTQYCFAHRQHNYNETKREECELEWKAAVVKMPLGKRREETGRGPPAVAI